MYDPWDRGFFCWGRGSCARTLHHMIHKVEMYNSSLLKGIDHTDQTKEGSTKIVNFMTLGAGVLVLGCGDISHIVKMHYLLPY